MKTKYTKFIFFSLFLAALLSNSQSVFADDQPCGVSGDGSSLIVNTSGSSFGCLLTPTEMAVSVKQVFFCNSPPSIPAGEGVISLPQDCRKVIDNPSAGFVQINVGRRVGLSADIPPNGSYTRVIMIIDNKYGVRGGAKFKDSSGSDADLYGKSGHGKYCWTLGYTRSETEMDANSSAYAQFSNRANWGVECGDSLASPEMLYTILDNISDIDGNGNSVFNGTVGGVNIQATYVDGSRHKHVNDHSRNNRVFMSYDFSSSPIIISDNTTNFNLKLPVTNGMSTQFSNNGGHWNLYHYGAGAPFPSIEVINPAIQ